MPEFPSVITEATDRMLLEQRRAENDAIARMICDTLSGYSKLHAEVTASCTDIFSDTRCRFDQAMVRSVARLG